MTIRFGNLSDGARVRVLQDIPVSRTQKLSAGSTGRIEALQFHPSSWQVELRFSADEGFDRELWLDAGDGIAPAAQRCRQMFEVIEEVDGLPEGDASIWPPPRDTAPVSSPLDAPTPMKVDRVLLGDTVRLRQDVEDSLRTQAPAGLVARIVRLESDGAGDGGVVVMTLAPRPGPELTLRFGRRWFGDKGHARFREVFEIAPAGGFRTPLAGSAGAGRAGTSRLGRLVQSVLGTPGTRTFPPSAPLPPEVSAPLEHHLDYLLDLAAANQYARAEAHWQAVRGARQVSDPGDLGHDQNLAEAYGRLALRVVEGNGRISDPQLWSWFKDAALGHWQAWAAQSTSGGEGTARSRQLREAEQRFASVEARHQRALAGKTS